MKGTHTMMPAPNATAGDQPKVPSDGKDIRSMLLQAVTELKRIASENGIDLAELIGEAGEPSAPVPSGTPAPRPPMPQM